MMPRPVPTRNAAGTSALEASLPAEPRPGHCRMPSRAEQIARVGALREALAVAATALARRRLRALLGRAEQVLATVASRG